MEELHLYIYDQIGNEYDDKGKLVKQGVLGANIQKQIARNPNAEKIILHINSPGGSVYEGNFIHNVLKASGLPIEAHVEFMCASIATSIANTADKIYIAKNGKWLVHEASGGGFGKASDLENRVTELKIINASLINDYKKRTGKTKAEIAALMAEDREMSAAEAIQWGFCDGYLEDVPANLTQFSKAVAFYSPIAVATTALAYEDYLADSLGYKRSEMPQIPFEFFNDFVAYFKAKYGEKIIKVGEMPLGKMLPTQGEFNASKVQDKIASGDWSERNYILSKENNLLDGHHDWAAGLESDPKQMVSYTKINLPIAELISESNALKITKQQSVRSRAKNLTNQIVMNKYTMAAVNAAAKLQRMLAKADPTACADIAPSNMMGTLADGTTVVEYDKLEVGGKVQLVSEADGSLSNPPAGDHTIDGVVVTVDAEGNITAVPSLELEANTQALATATARISELEASLATATTTIAERDATIEASNKLYNDLTAKMNTMAALVPQAGQHTLTPQNSGKGKTASGASDNPALDAVAQAMKASLTRNRN